MQIEKTILEGVLIITPKVFQDNRGYFYESFSNKDWEEKYLKDHNHSNDEYYCVDPCLGKDADLVTFLVKQILNVYHQNHLMK